MLPRSAPQPFFRIHGIGFVATAGCEAPSLALQTVQDRGDGLGRMLDPVIA